MNKHAWVLTLCLTSNLLMAQAKAMDFPAFDLQNLNSGQPRITMDSIQTPYALVNFWASWCGICKAEMPKLLKMVEAFDGQMSLLAISTDEQLEDAVTAYTSLQQKHPKIQSKDVSFGWDQGQALSLGALNVMRVPETFVLKKVEGARWQVVDKVVGKHLWHTGRLQEKLK